MGEYLFSLEIYNQIVTCSARTNLLFFPDNKTDFHREVSFECFNCFIT